jgi:23S rRNA pseudouridine2457 synthase
MEKITIEGFEVGEVREMDEESIYHKLGLTGFRKTGGGRKL